MIFCRPVSSGFPKSVQIAVSVNGFDLITLGDRTFRLAQGFGNFVDTLAADFPNEREGLRQYVEALKKYYRLKNKIQSIALMLSVFDNPPIEQAAFAREIMEKIWEEKQ